MAVVGQVLTTPESGFNRYRYTDSNFQYSSGWDENNGNDKITSIIGSTIKFNFQGDSIYIIVYSWNNRGTMTISIDGETPVEFKGYQNINSTNVVAFAKTDLRNKWHDAVITHKGSGTGTFTAIDTKGGIAKYDDSYTRAIVKFLLKSNNKNYSLKSAGNLTQLPSVSEKNFINYGVNSVDNFNLIQSNKNYILSKNESEGTDGLWVQEINRKPSSIKFE